MIRTGALTCRGILGIVTMCSFLWGCEGDNPTTPVVRDPAQLYAALRANHKAIILSVHEPYNTVQLSVSALSLTGDTLSMTEAPQFKRVNVLDTSVRVDADGLITARSATSNTRVEAKLTIGTVTRTDTVIIMVRAETPVRLIDRLEFSPEASDSNWRWATERTTVNTQRWVRLFDADNLQISASQALVYIVPQNLGVFYGLGGEYVSAGALIGETYVYASVYAYGKSLIDSTLFRRVDPPVRLIVVSRVVPAHGDPMIVFSPSTMSAKVGSTVVFWNRFDLAVTDCSDFGIPGFFCSPSSRIRRTTEIAGDTLVWVDSVDFQFTGPAPVVAGDPFGAFGIFDSGLEGPIVPDGAGNIPAFALVYCLRTTFNSPCTQQWADNGSRSRKFTVPGTYHITSTRFPEAKGTIIITE